MDGRSGFGLGSSSFSFLSNGNDGRDPLLDGPGFS